MELDLYVGESYEAWKGCLDDLVAGGCRRRCSASSTTFDEMVCLGLRHAKARSLSTDGKILLATPAAVISRKEAC